MGLHSELAGDLIHTPFRFVYPNAAARESAQGLTSQSINKLALQSDNYSVWILKSVSPLVWEQIGDKDLGTTAKRNVGTGIGNVPEIVDIGGGVAGIKPELVRGTYNLRVQEWSAPGGYTFTMPSDSVGIAYVSMIGGGGANVEGVSRDHRFDGRNGGNSSFGIIVAIGGQGGLDTYPAGGQTDIFWGIDYPVSSFVGRCYSSQAINVWNRSPFWPNSHGQGAPRTQHDGYSAAGGYSGSVVYAVVEVPPLTSVTVNVGAGGTPRNTYAKSGSDGHVIVWYY